MRGIFFAAAACAVLGLAGCASLPDAVAAKEKTLIWIDTDSAFGVPGFDVDDAWAIVAAFHSPDLEVVGVSAVFGEAPLNEAYAVAGELTGRFGPAGLTVVPGAAGPWQLGRETNASVTLEKALEHQPLKILALGPLTNVATVLLRHPELHGKIVEIVAVAGRRPGERLSWGTADSKEAADLNFERDPDAMRVVLSAADVPLTLVPLETSSKVFVNETDLDRLSIGGEAARVLSGPSRDWLALWRRDYGLPGFPPFEAAAAMYLSTPVLLRCPMEPAEVVLSLPEGPYLLVSSSFTGIRPVRYCSWLSPYYKESLLRRILSEEDYVYKEEPNLR